MNNYHTPVLLEEVIAFLNVKKGERYIDATLGGGGHAGEIINHGGIVLGIDIDQDTVGFVRENQKSKIPASPAGRKNQKLRVAKGNFRDIDKIAKEEDFDKVTGVLFDLGLSSYQIDNSERGFSYLSDGPLDMRMDSSLGVRASDLLNALGKRELVKIFRQYGEEGRANLIATRIVEVRKTKKFEKTSDLVDLLINVYGFGDKSNLSKSKSNKRVFQALRILVNDELDSLSLALPKALGLLKSNGRIVVITFHSLEDRIVKKAFLGFEKSGEGKVLTKRPIYPTQAEIGVNSKSRSAKLRVFQKN